MADSKPRWGDEVSEELGDELPPPQVVGPDKNGIKIVTEYYVDEDGKKWKVVRKIKVKKITQKVNPEVARRRHLKKFGNAAQHGPGPNMQTTNVGEDVPLKLGEKTNNETEGENDAALATLKKKDKMVVCRICKGDHWTLKCPYKETIGSLVEITTENPDKVDKPEPTPEPDSGKPKKYVPPSLRSNAGGERAGESMNSMRDKEKELPSLRVSNLSEDTKETDVQDLFRRFGAVQRVYLARDKIDKRSKGFAYVSFYNQSEAEKALQALNGYGYDNLILRVEWSSNSRS